MLTPLKLSHPMNRCVSDLVCAYECAPPLAIRTASVGCPARPIVELTSSPLSFNTPSLAAVCILLLVSTLGVSAVDSCVNDFNATAVVAKSYADLASYLANNSSDFRLIDIQQDIIVEETLQTPVGMDYELTQ